jgi:hypothetical protein
VKGQPGSLRETIPASSSLRPIAQSFACFLNAYSGVITMRETSDHDAPKQVITCRETSDHDAAKQVITIARDAHS